jgi:predicted HD phosphohydrolase
VPIQQLDDAVIQRVVHPTADPALAARRLRAAACSHLLGHHGVDQGPQPIRVPDPTVRAKQVEVVGRLQPDRVRRPRRGDRRGRLVLRAAAALAPLGRRDGAPEESQAGE